jgi:hypothetical protein
LPILSNLEDLRAQLPEPERDRPGVLALDVSKRAIGVTQLPYPPNESGRVA